MAFNWKKTLAAVAPTLATALGGPVAGTAVAVLGKALLGDEDAGQAAVSEAISAASPETLAKLKEVDAQFQVDMAELGVDVYALEVEDRKDARKLASNTMLWPQIVIGAAFIVGYFALLFVVGLVDDFKVDPVLLGVLTAGLPAIIAFFFGSSSGSKEKNVTIAELKR